MLPNGEHAGGDIGLRKMITHVSTITIASTKKDARELFTIYFFLNMTLCAAAYMSFSPIP